MRIALFWNVSLLLALHLTAESFSQVEGVLREKGTRKPIVGANVFVLPHQLKATTDAEGRFRFENIPPGEFTWIINQSGYLKLEKPDSLDPELPSESRKLYLEKLSYQVYETTIIDKDQKRDDRTRAIPLAELLKQPGANNDPIKAVQNQAGVNRAPGFSSQVIIEGSAPQDTRYLMNEHEIPIIFHFGGFTSIVFPEALERIDFLAAGYGPEFSRGLGGQIGAATRLTRKDRFAGLVFADTFQAGALFETPLGSESGVLLGARQSYIGSVLKAVSGKRTDSSVNLQLAPKYSDVILLADTRLAPAMTLKLTGIASVDNLKFLLDDPVGRSASGRGNFTSETAFYRLIPEWTYQIDETLKARASFGIGKDLIRVDVYDDYFSLDNFALSARGEIEKKFSDHWKGIWGYDNRYNWAKVGFRLPSSFSASGGGGPMGPPNPRSSTTATLSASPEVQVSEIGLYTRQVFKLPDTPFTFFPGVRLDYFTLTHEVIPAPRLGAHYQWDPSFQIRTAGGLYAQGPQPGQADGTIGNPGLKAPRAWHATLGFEKDFREGSNQGFVLTSDLFYRRFFNLVVPSKELILRNNTLVPERYNNAGTGHAYGISNSLRFNYGDWSGLIAYTLSRSRRSDPGNPDYRFRYDQTHILNAVGSVNLGSNWTLSTRIRYTTGNAYTPILGGVFDSDDDVFRPIQGGLNSDRYPPFFTWDVRADKKWIYDTWILSLYLDVQNLLNRKNVETINYSYDYAQKEEVRLLPLIPTLGLKGEF